MSDAFKYTKDRRSGKPKVVPKKVITAGSREPEAPLIKRIAIIAGDRKEAADYALNWAYLKGQAFYVRDVYDLRGIRNVRVEKVGTYHQRKDWPQISRQLDILLQLGHITVSGTNE